MTIFNPENITAWRSEIKRTSSLYAQYDSAIKLTQKALNILDEVYCLQNPRERNRLIVRQEVADLFCTAARSGYPLATCFEGFTRIYGFGYNKVDPTFGNALVQVAAGRDCAEALNYLALCNLPHNLLPACKMLQKAAHSGHLRGTRNFKSLAAQVRRLLQARQPAQQYHALKL